MTHIDDSTKAALLAALTEEKKTLTEELSAHGQKNEQGDWQGVSSSEGAEADVTDAADNIEELATNVSLVETLERRLKDVDDALQKMEAGTYGTCEVSGEEISLERLKANPSARTCIEHAA